MREKSEKRGKPSKMNPVGLSIVPGNGVRVNHRDESPEVVQCPACAPQTNRSAGEGFCETCGVGLTAGSVEPNYSGYEPNLVPTGHEVYHLKPTVRTVNERRHPRIPCRSVKACIKTEHGSSFVVNVVNMSKSGICFTDDMEFSPGTRVSIATHYIEGGHNIYQDGQIIRVHCKGSATLPGVYAVEFSGTISVRE